MNLFSFKKKKPTTLKAEEGKAAGKSGATSGGWFGGKQEPTKSDTPVQPERKPSAKTPTVKGSFGEGTAVLLQPRITEKATDLSEDVNAVVFTVHPSATKPQISAGVKELYGVTPEKVRIVQVPKKAVRGRRGERGVKSGGKKAYVYLKKGDKIEVV